MTGRIAFLTAVLIGAAAIVCAIWWLQFHDGDRDAELGKSGLDRGQSIGGPADAGSLATDRPDGGDISVPDGEETDDDRIPLAPTGPAELVFMGRAEMASGGPPPRPVELTAAVKAAPFTFFPIRELSGMENKAIISHEEFTPVLERPAAKTDAAGLFLIRGVNSADRHIVVLDPFLHIVRHTRKAPAAEVEAEPISLVLQTGCCLEGTVRDVNEKKLAGVWLTLRQRFDPMFAFSENKGARSWYSTVTDEEGKFRFNAVPCDTDFVLDAFLEGHGKIIAKQVAFRVGEVVPLDIVLPEAASISGLVHDRDSKPVAGINVRLSKTDDFLDAIITEEYDGAITVDSGDNGVFRFDSLAAGTYKVFIHEPGYRRTTVKNIKLAAGEERSGINLLLDGGLPIAGRIVDSAGNPVEGATIKVQPEFDLTRILELVDSERFGPVTQSDEEGNFKLTGLEEGNYDLQITRSGILDDSHGGIPAGTEDLVVTLHFGGIDGIVISTVDAEPVQAYKIALEPEGRTSLLDPFGFKGKVTRHVHHEQGKFELSPLRPGGYTMRFTADGFAERVLKGITVEDGRTTRGLLVMLPAESSVSGTVYDSVTGEPIEGARISLKTGLEAMIGEFMQEGIARTDEEGRYTFGGLKAGPVRLSVAHPRYEAQALEERNLAEGEKATGCDVYLSQGAVIHGHVLGPGRQPIVGVSIMASTPTASTLKSAKTDQDGYYEMSGFSPGSYQVIRMARNWNFDENFLESITSGFDVRVVKLAKDEVKEIDFLVGVEPESGLVRGQVTDSGGSVARAMVSVVPVDGAGKDDPMTRTATTDGEGRYSIKNVKPGEYTFRIVRTENLIHGGGAEVVFRTRVPDKDVYEYDMRLPGGSIQGRVLDADTSDPLSQIRLYLKRVSGGGLDDPISEAMGGRVGELYSDEDGGFKFSNLRAGTYDLRAGGSNILGMNPGGYAQTTVEGIQVHKDRTVSNVRIRVEKGGTIEGLVRDLRNDPVGGAAVFFQAAGQERFEAFSECYTDGSGKFAYTGLAKGRYTLAVKHSDFAVTLRYDVNVRKERTTSVTVTMEKGCALSVKLMPGTGAADIASARIDLVDGSGTSLSGLIGLTDLMEMFYADNTPSQGVYELGRYAPGTYHIRITHPDYTSPNSVDIVIQPGQEELTIPVSL